MNKSWKELSLKEKIKKISKYTTNILGMIAFILVGLDAIEGISIPYCTQIIKVIAVIQGSIGTYLIKGKLFTTEDIKFENKYSGLTDEESIISEGDEDVLSDQI